MKRQISKEDANKLFRLFVAYGQYIEMKHFAIFNDRHTSTEKYRKLTQMTNFQFQKMLSKIFGYDSWYEIPTKHDPKPGTKEFII